MTEAGIPFGLILTVPEAAEHPQLQLREMLVEIDDPALGTIKIPGIPIKMHDTPGSITKAAPLLGENTDEILNTLGFSSREIKSLHDRNVV